MKIKLLLPLLSILFFIGCKEANTKEAENVDKKPALVHHYICKNKCEDSGSNVEGICKTCNDPLIHNVDYHAKDLLQNGPLNVESNLPNQDKQNNTTTPIVNSNGIYHYSCPNGCPGGSGTVEKCKSCGENLAHNPAFHN
ncbi:MAG TPA: hypothetical protein VJ970_01825 [Flavobacteriaceae bacterium]|nr:hypothetical protein [Flavobacteriaceae bacterium]